MARFWCLLSVHVVTFEPRSGIERECSALLVFVLMFIQTTLSIRSRLSVQGTVLMPSFKTCGCSWASIRDRERVRNIFSSVWTDLLYWFAVVKCTKHGLFVMFRSRWFKSPSSSDRERVQVTTYICLKFGGVAISIGNRVCIRGTYLMTFPRKVGSCQPRSDR